jgi:acetyl esterase/lipase
MKPVLCLILSLVAFGAAHAAETAASRLTPEQRLDPQHLQATHEARLRFARERQTLPSVNVFEDFRAVIHVHAEDSNHTKGTREEVLAAAKKTGVRIVLFSDHGGPKPETWRGLRDGVLFLAGAEEGGKGLIRFPEFGPDGKPLPDGELRFLSHIEERYDASPNGFAGMEICNRHTDAVLDPSTYRVLTNAAANPESWRRFVEAFKAFPDEVFGAGSDYRPEIMAKWDRETQRQRFTGIGANDAHQNVIVKGVTFDPYEVSFRNLCTHILARELTEADVRQALREGHAYVSHDGLCDPTGFAFGAINNLGVFMMGDRAPGQGSTRMVGVTPLPARLKLFQNGRLVRESSGTNLTHSTKTPGAYRLEAWLTIDGEDRPWIYSNPVYLEEQSLLSMKLPNGAEAPNVEVKKDIPYGKPEDEAKHKLDLYLPKGIAGAPVFCFVHGGAWRYGDRWQYAPLGKRFAKEGVLMVVPSYRLAPKNPYPAQIEDVAAAFAWTVQHIAEYGGDTNRIYIGGHSAGGHLSALLTLHERYLQAHGLSAKSIKGVIALSGVYNLSFADALVNVFGKDPEFRRDASPLFHVRGSAPPFLVSYCQWDYATLPAQAKEFHSALRRAGVAAELLFTPGENHISEVIAMTYDNDPTAKAILKFIQSGAGALAGAGR